MILKLFATINNSPLSEESFNILLKLAEKNKRDSILQQKIKTNADNSLIGISLAKAGIKEVFGIDARDLIFEYDDNGKPFIPSYPHVHFNISHSKNFVVVAICDSPVGVDTETFRKFNPKISEKLYGDDKTKEISLSKNPDKEYTMLWTQKEAVLKLYGIGISGFRDKSLQENCLVKSMCFKDYCISVALFKKDSGLK